MRAYLLEKFYELSTWPYQTFFKAKTQAWNLTVWDLYQYPDESLGYDLGVFLQKNGFQPQEKLESHDVFHVLSGTGVSVPEEVSMQFYLYGNGKRSLYLYMVLAIGGLLYPDKHRQFKYALNQGQKSLPFYDLKFRDLLQQPTTQLINEFNIHKNDYKQMELTLRDYLKLRYKTIVSK